MKVVQKFLVIFISLIFTTFINAAEFPSSQYSVEMDDGHSVILYSRIGTSPWATILLIHGRTWSAIPDFDLHSSNEDLSMMNALAEQGFAVYAVDLRGYGKTPRDASGWNTPNRAAQDINNILTFIGNENTRLKLAVGEKINLFGWSYGSMVAMLTAQQYPQQIQSITLYGFPRNISVKTKNSETPLSPPMHKTSAAGAAEDFIVEGSISETAIAAYVKSAVSADPIRMDWNQLEQWNQLDAEAVKVPTLLLQAEFDPYANAESDAELFKHLGTNDKQWIVLANADHAALLEKSRFKLYHAVTSFVRWLDK